MAIVERGMEKIGISESPMDALPGVSLAQVAKKEWQRIQKKICPCRSKPPTIPKPQPLCIPKYWTDDRDYLTSRGKPIGIVTLEDVIEALIQTSILDEKDISLGRRRMKGNSSPNSSRMATSSEQTRALISRESLAINREIGVQTPPFGLELCDTRFSHVSSAGHQPKKFVFKSEGPPIPRSEFPSERSGVSSRRRVSFPDDHPEGDGAPYLRQDMEMFDGRNFKSKTFPRSKEYSKTNMDNLSSGVPLVDLLGPMSEDIDFVTISGHGIGALGRGEHTTKDKRG